MAAPGIDPETPPASGWNLRLYLLWIWYTAVAYFTILTVIVVLALLGADVLHVTLSNHRTVVVLLIATGGAVLFGVVLGSLQWRVIRERAAMPRRKWIVANTGPALLGWLVVIIPSVIQAENSDQRVSSAYLLAASQTLALGPLLGVSQAVALRPVTTRWASWIAANIVSWFIVDLVLYLLSDVFSALDFARRDGSVAEVYLMLIASTPLTGRWLLWVLAPAAIIREPEPAS